MQNKRNAKKKQSIDKLKWALNIRRQLRELIKFINKIKFFPIKLKLNLISNSKRIVTTTKFF